MIVMRETTRRTQPRSIKWVKPLGRATRAEKGSRNR